MTTMSTRNLGCLPDPNRPYDARGRHLLAAVQVTTGIPSITHARSLGCRQGHASSCFGVGLASMIETSLRLQGSDSGPTYGPVSPSWIYQIARREVWAASSACRPPLEDSGCYPGLGFDAVQYLGFCSLADAPYEDSHVCDPLPSSWCRAAYDQSELKFYRLDDGDPVALLREALTRQHVPGLRLNVDQAFMDHTGEDPIESLGDSLGGHWLPVLEVDPTGYVLIDNHTWENWGFDDGLAWVSPKVIRDRKVCGDLIAIRAAPVPSWRVS